MKLNIPNRYKKYGEDRPKSVVRHVVKRVAGETKASFRSRVGIAMDRIQTSITQEEDPFTARRVVAHYNRRETRCEIRSTRWEPITD